MSTNDPLTGRYAIKTFTSIGHKLYLNEGFANFHFIFKSKTIDDHLERIPVHKNILGNVSDVFQVMFNGSWKEKVDVELVDASVDAFKEFLQFFYLSEAKVTSENVAEVMNLGKKYDVTECFDVCGQFLKDHVTDDDVCVIYGLASHLEHKELEKECVEYIEWNAKAILTSENFLKCDRKVVQKILQMNSLCCSEVEVFEALMKWMKAKIKPSYLTQQIAQERFSDLLQEIRFGSMTFDEFASLDAMYGELFTIAEHREIIQMIHSEQFQPKIFKKSRRKNLGLFSSVEWNEGAIVKCDRYKIGKTTPYFIKNIETTTFTVDKPVALGAFTCTNIFRFADNTHQSPVAIPHGSITIFELPDPADSNRKLELYKEDQMFQIQNETTRVTLPKPIVIRPEHKYEIQIQIQLTSTEILCTAVTYKREVHMEPDITVKFQNDPIIDNEAKGLVRWLEFNKI